VHRRRREWAAHLNPMLALLRLLLYLQHDGFMHVGLETPVQNSEVMLALTGEGWQALQAFHLVRTCCRCLALR
jgi:hypothetical protein